MAVELSSIVLRGYNPRKASAFATLTSAKSAVNPMVLSETFKISSQHPQTVRSSFTRETRRFQTIASYRQPDSNTPCNFGTKKRPLMGPFLFHTLLDQSAPIR